MKASAVELFCGAGGLTYGLEEAGIDVRAGIDVDESCHYPYEQNNEAEFIEGDIREVSGDKIGNLLSGVEISILAGCAPCQPFSTMSQGHRDGKGEKWSLLREFGDLVKEVEPNVVAVENVVRIVSHGVFDEFVEKLVDQGYEVSEHRVKCSNYGVPQTRRRLVLIASNDGRIELKSPTHDPDHPPTVREHIGDLPPLEAGETDPEDLMHRCRNLAEINIKRIQASEPGGTWRDWPEEYLLECHKKESGRSYDDVYGRMEWDKPAPTITTQAHKYGTGRFGHPEQDRAISMREAATLQTFPPDYRFIPPEKDAVSTNKIMDHIGNAVPVELAKTIGESILESIAAPKTGERHLLVEEDV